MNQNVGLTANVGGTTPVNAGSVTFSVKTAQGTSIGTAVTATVSNGVASATFVLPGGTPPQTLMIVAVYGGTADFAPSSGSGSLVVGLADTTVAVDVTTMPVTTAARVVTLSARVAWNDTVPIAEGTVTFAVRDAAGTPVGTPVTAAVADGIATADYMIPGGLANQRLTTSAAYSGGIPSLAAPAATSSRWDACR